MIGFFLKSAIFSQKSSDILYVKVSVFSIKSVCYIGKKCPLSYKKWSVYHKNVHFLSKKRFLFFIRKWPVLEQISRFPDKKWPVSDKKSDWLLGKNDAVYSLKRDSLLDKKWLIWLIECDVFDLASLPFELEFASSKIWIIKIFEVIWSVCERYCRRGFITRFSHGIAGGLSGSADYFHTSGHRAHFFAHHFSPMHIF